MSRSRSTRAHQKVIDAALKLFAAEGIDATSMDAIAATSGVSKATIYKHWRDKEALCLEVVASLHGLNEPVTKTGDHRADMVAVLKRQPEARRDDVCARLMPHLAAYAARNPAFNKAWRASMLAPARIQLTQLLKRAIAEGSLPRRPESGCQRADADGSDDLQSPDRGDRSQAAGRYGRARGGGLLAGALTFGHRRRGQGASRRK